jgi:5-hydroxyisourate hydrolase
MSSVSSHVLDTALGLPARKLRLRLQILELVEAAQHWTTLVETVTDDNGRVPSFSPDTPLRAGTYRLCFDTKTYFEAGGRPVFFPQVDVVFAVDGADEQHYHVPLLLSPFGYSTYRGS